MGLKITGKTKSIKDMQIQDYISLLPRNNDKQFTLEDALSVYTDMYYNTKEKSSTAIKKARIDIKDSKISLADYINIVTDSYQKVQNMEGIVNNLKNYTDETSNKINLNNTNNLSGASKTNEIQPMLMDTVWSYLGKNYDELSSMFPGKMAPKEERTYAPTRVAKSLNYNTEGSFDPLSGTISLNPDSGYAAEAFGHEVGHYFSKWRPDFSDKNAFAEYSKNYKAHPEEYFAENIAKELMKRFTKKWEIRK